MVLLERKVIAWVQVRLGPMRVGPYGVLQPIADAVKLILKEDITPTRADKWVFTAASIIVYGIILGGWASNSKFPLLASLRASAQLISYEVAVTMTLVSMIMTAGTLSMVKIVESQ